MRGPLSHFPFLSLPFPVAPQGPRRERRPCAGRWEVGRVSGGSPLRPVEPAPAPLTLMEQDVSDPITEPERSGAGPRLPGATLRAVSDGRKDSGDLGTQEGGRGHPTWSAQAFHAPLRRVAGGFPPVPVVLGWRLDAVWSQSRRGRKAAEGAGGLRWLQAPGGGWCAFRASQAAVHHGPRGCRHAHLNKRRRKESWKNQWFGECVCTWFSYGS